MGKGGTGRKNPREKVGTGKKTCGVSGTGKNPHSESGDRGKCPTGKMGTGKKAPRRKWSSIQDLPLSRRTLYH